ncbi:formiminotransferase N-terminal subdomain-containing protein isoform X2 [Rhinoraja longicauda]
MASRKLSLRLAVCLLNISEARKKDIVERVATAALCGNQGQKKIQTTVLNIFSDYDYNRSVLTLAGPVETLDVAERLTHDVPDCSLFYFGYADQPLKRSLVQRRKELNWFNRSGLKGTERKADVGAAISSRCGLTGIGASPYVMNCNVTIDTQDLNVGQQIASAVRGANVGGLTGIQAMAFPHEGTVEIACNVESFKGATSSPLTEEMEKHISYCVQGEEYVYFSPSSIEKHIEKLANNFGVATVGTALVGFTPERCKHLAEKAIGEGTGEFWKKRKVLTM